MHPLFPISTPEKREKANILSCRKRACQMIVSEARIRATQKITTTTTTNAAVDVVIIMLFFLPLLNLFYQDKTKQNSRTKKARHRLSSRERSIVTWLTLTAIIHVVVEGYVVLTPSFYRSTSRFNFLAEVWREYAKADSRYATRDAFTICMEFVTAFFVGPLCLFSAREYCKQGKWRHVAALVASVCQLYGDALYFATCFYENGIHTRPEPLYFWFYFVGLNGVWVVVPLLVCWHALGETLAAQERSDSSSRGGGAWKGN